MTQIQKFSLLYDSDEDRLAWDAEDPQGATTRLWLTQRLCRGLIKALVPMLQQTAQPDLPPQHAATVQSWEQQAAMADFGHVPSVQPSAETVVGLVKAVHIQPTNGGMNLTFEFGAEESRAVSLAHPAVRQMLTVLYRLNVAAGWALDLWPSWIADPITPPPTETVN
ncbi:MAG: hypothetical protein P4L64_06655 [Caulobacteraceae bacterium]|nr:hypothetical protein [Caulobacteraceae bacterium]